MAIKYLPQPPRELVQLSRNVALYLQELDRLLNNTSTFEWGRLDFTGSDLADLVTKNHNDLDNFDGGTTGEYNHLTDLEYSKINLLSGLSIDTDKDWNDKDLTNVDRIEAVEISLSGSTPITFEDTLWDDMRVAAQQTLLTGAATPDWETWLTGLQVLAFDDTTEEEAFLSFQMSHAYKLGTNIHPHIHWVPSDASAGTVRWGMEYSWANIGDVFPSTTTIYIEQDTNSTANEHLMAEFAAIDWSSNDGVSAMLFARIFRDATDAADDYAADAYLLEFDVHFEIDTPGSSQEDSKT